MTDSFKYVFFILMMIPVMEIQAQNGLDIVEGPVYFMDCDSPCTMLHANFPKPLKTNLYTASSIPFSPINSTGTPINLSDDQFSGVLPIGFPFCFFEQVHTQCVVADNGVLSFNLSYANGNCNNNTQQTMPYFNSTFPDNAIFFMFMDVDPSLGGSVSYFTTGTAPFRKFVINFQQMKIFGSTCFPQTSSYQVVLNETTNLIEIHVTNKTTCDSNPLLYSNYATMGVQNTGAITAFTAPGKHAAQFTMSNESIQFAPAGAPNYTLRWRDAVNNVIALNTDSLYYCPGSIPYNKIRAEIDFYCPFESFKDSVILDKNLPTINSVQIVKPLCNGDSTGVITILANSANPPLSYAFNGGPFGSSNVLTNIPPGFYYISVKDNNGCRRDSLVQVQPQYQPAIVVDTLIRPICPDSNGKIVINVLNATPPYTINWANGASGTTLTGLSAGVYPVVVTDANGCTTQLSVVLPFDSIPIVQYTVSKPVCGDSSGMINLTMSNGTAPYQFLWNTGDTTQNLTQVAAGTYQVVVADVNGCSVVAIIGVSDTLTTQTSDTVLSHSTCGLHNGVAMIAAIGGIPPYTYSWSPGGQTSSTAINLAPGIYICTTQDSALCTQIDTLTINPSLPLQQIISSANANCDSSNGKIFLNAILNQTGWVNVLWSNGDTSTSITGLTAGTYWVKSTDSLGCTRTDTIQLSNDGRPFLGIVSYTPPLCYGDSTGQITLTGTSGTAPYKYSLDGINFSSFAQLSNIAGGTYTIYITDANSCPNDTVVTFPQPSEILITYSADTVICYDDQTSTLSIQAQGGFPPYTYSFDQGAFTPASVFNQLSQGNFILTVKDSNQCEVNFNIIIPGPPSPLMINSTIADVPCFETNSGSVSIAPSGGWPPYQYSWSNGFTGLVHQQIPETHTSFKLTDSIGCEINESIDVDQLLCCKAIVPNAFSPNGDTKNDVLRVMPISEVSSIRFRIYDRWGKNIFSTDQLGTYWDGRYKGQACDMDVYFYYLEYTCPFQKEKVILKGDITLLH